MATKSIYKDVRIKDRVLSRHLISALENAQRKKAKDVVLSRSMQIVSGEGIKKMLERE